MIYELASQSISRKKKEFLFFTGADSLHFGRLLFVYFRPKNDWLNASEVLEGSADDGGLIQRISGGWRHHRRRVEARIGGAKPAPGVARQRLNAIRGGEIIVTPESSFMNNCEFKQGQ